MKTSEGKIHSFAHESCIFLAEKCGKIFKIIKIENGSQREFTLKRNELSRFFFEKEILAERERNGIKENEAVFIQVQA